MDAQSGHILDGLRGSAPADVVELLMVGAGVGEVLPRRPGRRRHHVEPVESRGRNRSQPEEECNLPVKEYVVQVQRDAEEEEEPNKDVVVMGDIVEESGVLRVWGERVTYNASNKFERYAPRK